MRAIILPAYLLAHLLLAPLAGASDAEWLEYARMAEHDPHRANAGATEALSQARARNDKAGQIRALRLRVQASCMGAAVEVDIQDVDEGLMLAREAGDMDSVAWFLYEKSWLEFENKGHEAANVLLDEGLAISEQHGLQRTLAWIYMRKGEILARIGRNSDAMSWLSKAYARFQTLQDAEGMALTLKLIMRMNSAENSTAEDKAKAIAYGKQALGLIDPQMYRATAAGLNNTLGSVYFGLRDFANAKLFLERALAASLEMGSIASEGIADVRYKLARLAQEEKRFADALGYLDAAGPIFEKIGRKRRLVETLVARAEVLAQLGRTEESLEALATARPILAQADSPEADVYYHEHAAALHAKSGNLQEAYRQMVALRKTEQRLAETANIKLSDELKIRFDVQLKEAENALLRTQQKEAHTRQLAIYLGFALSLLLLVGVAVYLRRRAAVAKTEAAHQREVASAAAAANRAKGTFLSNMSHELRSPLNAMLGFTRMLIRDPRLFADGREDLEIVLRSGEHLYTLINQVLDLSKIEAGYTAVNETNFDFFVLLDELAEMFTMVARQKGLQLIVDHASDVPQYVRTDMVKLRQVLINLLSNAFKFTVVGKVTLRIARYVPRQCEEPDGYRLSFAVIDSGPGIAADELQELGSAFVQAQSGRQAKEGTGLGLALSRGFVQLMGGKLELSSELGQGTTVAFTLPIAVVDASAIGDHGKSDRRVVGLAKNQSRYRILTVDDRPEGRQLLIRLLSSLGFEVREAGNGQEAIDLWEAWEPHLIFMDMRMPVMDGHDATRRIKASDKGKATIIIALTASSFEEERGKILADGCDDFLRKPFQERDLFNIMQQHLGVQYEYEQVEAAAPLDKTHLLALPAELRAKLGDALRQLDSGAIDDAIAAIQVRDAALAQWLDECVKQFDYGRILALLPETES